MVNYDIQNLTAEKLKALRAETGLNQQRFAILSNNSRETLINYEKRKNISKGARRGIIEAAHLIINLSAIMEPINISNWLVAKNEGLQGKSPIDLIKEGRVDIIWSIIEETRRGTFA